MKCTEFFYGAVKMCQQSALPRRQLRENLCPNYKVEVFYMRKILPLLVFACVINFIFCARLFAATPNRISYQGILKEKGNFVSATKTMKFSIFDALTG
ncbi:MAG: hypothetical protein CVU77_06505 [Elusimicrobia bacterium HGW-Elusimicrobia-1]|nr:MAG: hypothetical protein CVU77_06505 [Elusimicrobia bacterium HGW-Elusimicrobia-1]